MSTKNKPSLEEQQATLAEMLAWFESDDFAVEQAREKFDQAQKLATEIETQLLDAKNEIQVLSARFDEA